MTCGHDSLLLVNDACPVCREADARKHIHEDNRDLCQCFYCIQWRDARTIRHLATALRDARFACNEKVDMLLDKTEPAHNERVDKLLEAAKACERLAEKGKGLALRDQFAMQALKGFMTNGASYLAMAHVSKECYRIADVMLEERSVCGKRADENYEP